MTEEEVRHRGSTIITLAAMFGKTFSNEMMVMFLRGTADIPRDKFDLAVERAFKECRFMPTGVEFRQMAMGPTCRVKPLTADEIRNPWKLT